MAIGSFVLPFRNRRIVTTSLKPNASRLGQRVISGAFWTFGAMGLRVVLTIFSTAVLARLLTPEDFGLIAMSSLVTELAGLLGNVGVGFVLIQKQRLRRTDLDTTFWIALAIGIALCLLTVAVSFLADRFFQAPMVRQVLWGSSLLFVLEELAAVHTGLLNRQLMFREDMFIQIGMLVVRIGVSIGLARLGWGVWSLVVGALAGRAIATLLAWYIVPFVPKLRFDRRFFAQHWRSGGSILGSGILNYLMSNLDYWVIGRRFGATELGYYQVAFSLPEELRNRLSGPLQRILFPAYSRLQNNDEAFRKGVFKSVRVLSTVVVPMGIGMAAVAPDLVRVLYGEQWIAAIPLLQILAVGGVMRALFSLVASIYYAKGRPDLAFKISLYSLPYVALVIVIGSEWGVIGVAWAMVVVQIPSFFAINIAMRLIHASSMSFYRQIIPPVLAGLTMVWLINIVGFNPYIQQLLPIYKLGCLVVSGAVGYGLCIIAISKIHTKDLLELARVVP